MRNGGSADDWRMAPLLEGAGTALASPDPAEIQLSNPTLVVLQSGRLLLSVDQAGPGVKNLPGKKGTEPGSSHRVQGIILAAAGSGAAWEEKDRFPFGHSRMFRDGHGVYVIGHTGPVQICKSASGGESWGKPAALSRAGDPDMALGPANVLAAGDNLYAVFLQNTAPDQRGDPASALAPVVWRAEQGANLTDSRAWVQSDPCPPFRRLVTYEAQDLFGVPFFPVPKANQGAHVDKRRWAFRTGWRETHLLQIADPAHAWHDPNHRTFHLLSVGHTHRSGLAILTTLTETDDGRMGIGLQQTPAGTRWVFSPLPGGHERFAVVYDEPSRRYWLVSAQSVDSLARPGRLGPGRRGLPCDESHRWQLSYSHNLVDWVFAGCLFAGEAARVRYGDPSAAVHGNDIHLAFRRQTWSPDRRTDEIICGSISGFRDLAY